MKQLNEFLIPFAGLKLGKHQFEFNIDRKFFDEFGYDEFEDCNLLVKVQLDKKNTMLEVSFRHSGTVHVPCDLTGEYFDLPVKGKMDLIVQFGDEFNDDNEVLLILPHGEHQINVAQYIYEMIALSIPVKRVHPGVKDGTLKHEAIDRLNQMNVKPPAEKKEVKEENIDPRWDKLKSLLKDKK
ncbi:MAG: DUF177 domain-containing protein [Chitinophagaceae bacterium]|nr:MAG: DUF177 domain-containing protein [Chitinophagaceae bacterium]